ncbi:MAG: hypothetical protein ABMA01_21450 [Chthoniobacteraceae bacterium]
MKTSLVTATILLFACFARADETVLARFSWQEISDAGKLTAGVLSPSEGHPPALRIENPGGQAMRANILTVEKPRISTAFYAISGEVRYEHVEGDGFLEMWSHFGSDAAYFSRTLGASGPMAGLRGDSGWRVFTLPFDATGAKSTPSRLVINVQLPGQGTVFLRDLRLIQSPGFAALLKQPGAWWPDQTAGWIGGLGGAFLGCLGGLIEWLASRGKMPRFVLNASRILILIGAIAAIAGLISAALRQPYGVWYPLLLIGILCVAIFPFRLRRYQQRYRELELRRMSSLDLTAH